MKYCENCGFALDDESRFCGRCGALSNSGRRGAFHPGFEHPRRRFSPSRLLSVALAFILGSAGAHKFYLRRYVQGTLYLLLCWTFIPAIISFIEGIIYLCHTDIQFDEIYGK